MTDVASRPTTGDALLDLLNGFIVELREAGLPVSLTENLDAMAGRPAHPARGPRGVQVRAGARRW